MYGENENTWSPSEFKFNHKGNAAEARKEKALKDLAHKSRERAQYKTKESKLETEILVAQSQKEKEHQKLMNLEMMFGLTTIAILFACVCLLKKKQTTNSNRPGLASQGSKTYSEINYVNTGNDSMA